MKNHRYANPRRRLSGTLSVALTLCAWLSSSACSSLATAPAETMASLAGAWQFDPAGSDDFDRKLVPLMETQRHRMQPLRNYGGSSGGRGAGRGGGGGDSDGDTTGGDGVDALAMPLEEPEKVHKRLADDLRPPKTLHVALDGAAVEIASDAEPVRRFLPGQDVSRIDSSGAASLSSGWDQRAFVIRAKYTNRASRSWRYEVDRNSGLLHLSFEADDPEFGRLSLQTQYRRAP